MSKWTSIDVMDLVKCPEREKRNDWDSKIPETGKAVSGWGDGDNLKWKWCYQRRRTGCKYVEDLVFRDRWGSSYPTLSISSQNVEFLSSSMCCGGLYRDVREVVSVWNIFCENKISMGQENIEKFVVVVILLWKVNINAFCLARWSLAASASWVKTNELLSSSGIRFLLR